MEKIHLELSIAADPERAFEAFTAELAGWWPPEYTWSGGALVTIGMEPGAGGFCYEIGPHGFRCDWGRVVSWDPPRRLRFTWQIGPGREPVPDPARASEVEVRFHSDRLELEHRGFERHGSSGSRGSSGAEHRKADEYRKALASPEGWPLILKRFKNYLENQ